MFLLGYEDPVLHVVDLRSGAKKSDPAVMHLWGLAVDEQRGIVYATESQSKALLAIREDSGEETTIPVGDMPCAAAVDTRAARVYVVNYADNSVTAIDETSGKPVATIPVGEHPEGLAVDEMRHRVYVANTHSNSVTVIDGATNRVVATLPGGRNPYAVAVDAEHGDVFVANFGEPSFTRLNIGPARR